MSATNLFYAFSAGILPSFIWLYFWLREDRLNPEPRWLIAASFLGGMVAVIAAVFLEKLIFDIVPDPSLRYTLWATVEEILKLLIVLEIALMTKHYDEPIDAMIYCIAVALGFAALENTFFILEPLAHGEIASGIVTSNLRFIGATLVHIVSSATIGFALGFAFYKSRAKKFIYAVLGTIAAIALHASFNLSIVGGTSDDTLRTFAWVWVAVIVLIVLFEEIKAVKPKAIA